MAASVRNVIATILRRAGHDVTVASDAKQALQATSTAATPFELSISDVVMPGMGGVDGDDDRSVDYLAKPVTPKELLDRVDQLLGST